MNEDDGSSDGEMEDSSSDDEEEKNRAHRNRLPSTRDFSVPLPIVNLPRSVVEAAADYHANHAGAVSPKSDRENDPDYSPGDISESDLDIGRIYLSECLQVTQSISWSSFSSSGVPPQPVAGSFFQYVF